MISRKDGLERKITENVAKYQIYTFFTNISYPDASGALQRSYASLAF